MLKHQDTRAREDQARLLSRIRISQASQEQEAKLEGKGVPFKLLEEIRNPSNLEFAVKPPLVCGGEIKDLCTHARSVSAFAG
jgi:hypothetical protein